MYKFAKTINLSIQSLHTKFQANRLKNGKVMRVFHFQASKLVGWQIGLTACMFSSSIQRLHTKFQPNWLKNVQVMHVFCFEASRLVGWQVGLASRFGRLACSITNKSHTRVESFHLKTPSQISTKLVIKCQRYTHFSLLGWQAGRLV